MKDFEFIKFRDIEKNENFFAILGNNESFITSSAELFIFLQQNLQFPYYFGHNWDAFEECIKDFHWISEKNIILYHTNLPELSVRALKLYFTILQEAINFWKHYPEHVFRVIFEPSLKTKVLKVLT